MDRKIRNNLVFTNIHLIDKLHQVVSIWRKNYISVGDINITGNFQIIKRSGYDHLLRISTFEDTNRNGIFWRIFGNMNDQTFLIGTDE